MRGRGLNAPEQLYGLDGIFQIAVTTEEGVVVRLKGLPFQSKINWRGRSSSVTSQSADIEASTGEGIVVDYTTTDSIRCSVRAFGYPEVKFGKFLPAAQQPTPTELVFRKAKFLRSNVPP